MIGTRLFRLFFAARGNREKKHRGKYGPACIVISPAGLAMDQGDLKGKLRWDEILNLKSDGSSRHSQADPRVLKLKLSGAELPILDLYDKPLSEIRTLIFKNLSPSDS